MGNLTIDRERYAVTVGGEAIALTYLEFELLAVLARQAGRVVPRQELLHQVWGGGWLVEIPFLDNVSARDFAGSGVVHTVGGTAALVGALMLGPRIGRFGSDGKPRTIPGHSMTLVVLGTLILFLGWFGFNPGSTLAATDLRISVIAVNTFLAGITGGVVAYYIRFWETGKVDIAATCSGIIGGLVGITAPCAFVESWAAVVIGAVAGAVVVYGARALESYLKLDDPVWAVACHS